MFPLIERRRVQDAPDERASRARIDDGKERLFEPCNECVHLNPGPQQAVRLATDEVEPDAPDSESIRMRKTATARDVDRDRWTWR